MDNKNWAKAKEALDKGKRIVNDRIKLVKLADGSSWGTVKEFRSGIGGVEEGDEKRWKAAQRAVKEKAEMAKRENKYREEKSASWKQAYPSYRPYPYPYERPRADCTAGECSRSTSSPYRPYPYQNERMRTDYASAECWGCGKLGHFRKNCVRSRINNNM